MKAYPMMICDELDPVAGEKHAAFDETFYGPRHGRLLIVGFFASRLANTEGKMGSIRAATSKGGRKSGGCLFQRRGWYTSLNGPNDWLRGKIGGKWALVY
jgi:hypothetical protein